MDTNWLIEELEKADHPFLTVEEVMAKARMLMLFSNDELRWLEQQLLRNLEGHPHANLGGS